MRSLCPTETVPVDEQGRNGHRGSLSTRPITPDRSVSTYFCICAGTLGRMIVTVANVKGGVGKTTSAVLLAHALGAGVVDTDPQGSATAWGEAAAGAGTPLAVSITSLPTARLEGRLPSGEHLVIDTPPGDLTITKAAIAVADLVLVPTAPTALDMNRVWATLDLTSEAGKPTTVLLVKVRAGTRAVGASASVLTDEGVRIIETRIPLREALALAWGDPVTDLYGYDLVADELTRSARG